MSFTPKSSSKTLADAIETQSRVKQCRNVDLNWELHPSKLKLVSMGLNLDYALLLLHFFRAVNKLEKQLVYLLLLFSVGF